MIILRAHKLKIWPEPFARMLNETAMADLRQYDDRDFKVDDFVMLSEFKPVLHQAMGDRQPVTIGGGFTGRYLFRRISHITTEGNIPLGLRAGFVILHYFPCTVREMIALESVASERATVHWIEPRMTTEVASSRLEKL